MGNIFYRNRFWYYRSLYDDYMLREFRMSFLAGSVLWLPFYWWGVHYNREYEVMMSRKNYLHEYGPKRNRLTHSLLFEQFEIYKEKWEELEKEYLENKEEMDAELDQQ